MEILRTPDERFEDLARYPHAPRLVTVDPEHGLEMHYVDQGPREATPILMLHGEPTWSFLYRQVIAMVTEAGYRAVVPDLIGFGKSDKPASPDDYSYARHIGWVKAFIDELDLDRIVLVGHGWGGLIGLRLVADDPNRFARLVLTNTFLPTGEAPMPEAFLAWRELSQSPDLDVGAVIQDHSTTHVPPSVLEAYRAPFPDETYMAGVRAFPLLVPTEPDDPEAVANRRAWEELGRFTRPVLLAFGDRDPITAGCAKAIRRRIPGAQDVEPATMSGAHHFVQEDRGSELAAAILRFLVAHPLPKRPAAPADGGL
jgi:haloalkane dehalogenase